ncbi:MAG: class I SAM-dependent methyltransferase [Planctomycetaceae bacterium]
MIRLKTDRSQMEQDFQTAVIQRQYDDLIARHYDLDPQNITNRSLDRALEQLRDHGRLKFNPGLPPIEVLDLGMGTGLFLEKLRAATFGSAECWGIDLSQNMADIAQSKIHGLEVQVDDAANFDRHFPGQSFDLICTHFITGFVPIQHLAPLIHKRLKPGGCWSFVGSSKLAYPTLRRKAESPVVRMLSGGGKLSSDNMLCPHNENSLRETLTAAEFEILVTDTFEPELRFRHFDDFMEYAYTGGWLTPFIEEMGLERAGRATRALLNTIVFPVKDHHSILLGVARKPAWKLSEKGG